MEKDYLQAGLSEKEIAICAFAISLTKYPADHVPNDHTCILKEAGCTYVDILDITLVTSCFNFVNRMVLSLGVTLETHWRKENNTLFR